MSWLARSIVNGLRLDDDDEDSTDEVGKNNPEDLVARATTSHTIAAEDRPPIAASSPKIGQFSDSVGDSSHNYDSDVDPDGDDNLRRGVKEDLTELGDSIARQLWGVASFLAPPPPPPPPLPPPRFGCKSDSIHTESKSESDNDNEERGDEELVEYDGRDSGRCAELPSFSPSDDFYGNIVEEAIGITEEVMAFAKNIAHHPETWLDFPIEEDEFDDFDISDAQYKHVLAIEYLSPRLSALRNELCPVHMGEGYFWMVYFVLLHSRLSKHDADLLSSPQIVQARGVWMQELQKQTKESYWLGMSTFHSKESADSSHDNLMMHSYEDAHVRSVSGPITPSESSTHQTTNEHEIDKHSIDEIEFVDKSVIKEDPPPKLLEKEMVVSSSYKIPVQDFNDEDDDDGWVTEDSDLIGYSGPSIDVNEEDISFSDLEDDLDCTMSIKCKIAAAEKNTTTEAS